MLGSRIWTIGRREQVGVAGPKVLGCRTLAMTAVAIGMRVDDITAEPNQSSILSMQVEWNRRDVEPDLDLALILVPIRFRPGAHTRRLERGDQDGGDDDGRRNSQQFENWFRLHQERRNCK